MPLISAIVTCKGRLDHLQRTLPTLLALPDREVVVVDYDCPQGAGDWVEAAHPGVKVVRVGNRPFFNIAEARNVGAAAATAPWLLLTDADILFHPKLVEAVRPWLKAGVFLRSESQMEGLRGTLIVSAADFQAVGGYDEVYQGWGNEDVDLVIRLEQAGIRPLDFPVHMISAISHDNALRGQHHALSDPMFNWKINTLYLKAKIDLFKHGIELDRPARQALYDQITRGAHEPGGLEKVELTFRREVVAGMRVATTLRYDVGPADAP